jgi:hypothetical protein
MFRRKITRVLAACLAVALAAMLPVLILPTQADSPVPTLDDAIDILKHVAGLHALPAERVWQLDFDGTGGVTTDNAITIMKGAVGLAEMPFLRCYDEWKIKHLNYLSEYGIPSNADVQTAYVKGYSNGFAFFQLNWSPIGLENTVAEIGGYSFMRGRPTLFFYVFDTSDFLQIAPHNEENLLAFLSLEEICDLSYTSQFVYKQNCNEWYMVQSNLKKQ